jgi:hypothetical protein
MTTYNYCVSPTTDEEEARDMSRLFIRILSPVDFHENSFAALEYAAQFARQYDATVYLLHVIPCDSLRTLWIWGCRNLPEGAANPSESYKPLL